MGKRAPAAIKKMRDTIEASNLDGSGWYILEGSAVGDGYHHSFEDLVARGKRSAYSIQDSRDKVDGTKQEDAACAFDIVMGEADMKKATRRMLTAALEDDPRVKGKCREFGGTLDGDDVTAYNITGERYISFDDSHLWHLHLSIHRKYADDVDVCRGIAEVVAGVPLGSSGGGGGEVPEKPTEQPKPWDGKSYPGAGAFKLKKSNPAVTLLGQRLVLHGFGKYEKGPGPTFTEVDRAGVMAFQKAQGWDGDDADGYPGPKTWELLMKAPAKPAPTPKPKPRPKVDLSKVVEAAKLDPDRKQGGVTKGAEVSVKIIEACLTLEKLLDKDFASDGSFGKLTVDAYAKWQKKLGYKGKDANGVPGEASLKKLGDRYKFQVVT